MSWSEAAGFCGRLASVDEKRAKYRLPTEAEWEFASRGAKGRAYPWGGAPPASRQANLAGGGGGYSGLAPVGSFREGATPEGVMDLVDFVTREEPDRSRVFNGRDSHRDRG